MERVRDEALMVGRTSIYQIQEEERRLESEYLAYQEQAAKKQREREREVSRREERAKGDVTQRLRRRRRAVERREAQVVQRSMVKRKQLYSAFHKAEKQMIAALKARKAEVKTLYGHLERAEGYYGAVRRRRWKVDWSEAPQPIQIKIKALRGVRDKLPASRYVLLISLYDHLGGHALKWSKVKGQQWGAATLPVEHQGHYYDTEMKFDQNLYTVLPSQPNVRPGMVLLFELFIVRGVATPTDRVVGWGVFPISDADFNIIDGKYKCPLLRGGVDPLVDKHSKIEKLMAKDIDNWLSNLYFQVIKMPRYLQGMQEHEVELQFTSSLLGYPDRTHDERAVVDGNEPVHGNVLPTPLEGERPDSPAAWTEPFSHSTSLPPPSRPALASRLSRKPRYSSDSESSSSSYEDDALHGDQRRDGEDDPLHGDQRRDGEDGFQPVQDKPGLYYKVHDFNPHEHKDRHGQTLFPHTPMLDKRRRKAQSYEEELQEHTLTVKPPFSDKGRVERRMHERIQYVGRQFLSEMGLNQMRSLEFWGMLVFMLLAWWVRLYLHYIAQYGFLRTARLPINRFNVYPHTVLLNYQSTLLFTREEVAIVVLGPLFNTLVFCSLILLSWLTQLLFGTFPDLGSRFIAAFGLLVLLDPYLIFLVDMALLRYQAPQSDMPTADATKLYWHFVRLENNGIVGIFITLFLYVFTTFTTLSCYYMYFLRVHMNGRLIDIYHRLKTAEEKFFLPQDMEVSNEELGFICRKAEQWRGAEGERRKVAVYDYVWENEELDADRQQSLHHEVTIHISIHTIHLDGLRELHRHFLRLDNGAIIEIFGELSNLPGIKSGIKQALLQQHKTLTRPSTPYHQADTPTPHPSIIKAPPPDSPDSHPHVSLSSLAGQRNFPVKEQTYESADSRKAMGLQIPHHGGKRGQPPRTHTSYLSARDSPRSSSSYYHNTGTALDIEQEYNSGDDSVFEEDDTHSKGKTPSTVAMVWKGKRKSLEKQKSAGELV